MLGIILVLLVLWKMKPLTHLRIIGVCAACAYLFTFFQVSGMGANGQEALEATAVSGTIWFAIFCFVSWLIFRKRIQEPADDEPEEEDAPNNTTGV